MKTKQQRQERRKIVSLLECAFADLVEARKLAALLKNDSYEDIGKAINHVEAAFDTMDRTVCQ